LLLRTCELVSRLVNARKEKAMKKLGLMGVSFIACTLASSALWAVNWTTSTRVIVEVRQSHPNSFYEIVPNIPLTGNIDNPASCSDGSIVEMDLGITGTQRDTLNRTVLSAFLAGKPVRLHIKETAGACQNGHPIYMGIRIPQ
jgi:hypothetical protein